MGTVVLLVGPKAVGKTWVAEHIRPLGVEYVDSDRLVLELVDRGEQPHPEDGWLAWVQLAVHRALADHAVVSVEATGAWESDYRLAEHLQHEGHEVIRVWVTAAEEESIARLNARRVRRVQVDEAEARRIYAVATARASGERWDATIDTTGAPDRGLPMQTIGPLLPAPRGSN